MLNALIAAGIVAGMTAAGVAQAAPVYTSAWFFGDSLTDPGNLHAETGQPPSPPYFEGRTSNGPVWAEHVAGDFATRGLDTRNFAFAGAHALPSTDPTEFQIPDLGDQLTSFAGLETKRLGARPVAMLWFGANDVIGAIEDAPTPENVAAAAVGAAQAVAGGIGTLRGFGVKDFVLLNLPSLDQVPAFTAAPPGAAALAGGGSDLFNATLDSLIGEMKGKRRIKRIDMDATFADLIANPEKYGVEDATRPCIVSPTSVCSPDEADRLAFFDALHPNRVIHGEIAGLVRAEATPVPLPAPALLLLAGLAGLGLARVRAGFGRPAADSGFEG
jgi:phospholipase/lecithinase/hemolysin